MMYLSLLTTKKWDTKIYSTLMPHSHSSGKGHYLVLPDGADHCDYDGRCHDNAQKVLQDDRTRVGSRDDVGNQGVNDDERNHADDDRY